MSVPVYRVRKGVKGRLVNIVTQAERGHTATEDLEFGRGDIVFTPTSVFNTTKVVVEEYGFKTGTEEQRAKYIFVVATINVERVED